MTPIGYHGKNCTVILGARVFYDLYGLTLQSAIPLPARVASRQQTADHWIAWGDRRPVTTDPPPGDIIARWCLTETFGATLSRSVDRYIYRIHTRCDFEITRDLRRVVVHFTSDRDEALVPLFIVSSLIAVLLALRGETTLHASAVTVDGRALAIVGDSGAGKSTLAALLCQRPGVELVTDDLLRLLPKGEQLLCAPGAPDIRLRQSAARLAEDFREGRSEMTADSRVALRPRNMAVAAAPLCAIVLPCPRHDPQPLRIARLTGSRAMVALARNARVWPWTHQNNLREQFDWFAEVARAVPVYEADLPWGPPFDPAIAEALTELVASSERHEVTA
jgi:hypothetical protein